MSRKGGADGFDPHPGDPWHPDWTPEKDESDADFFIDEVEPLAVDESGGGGLLSRFRRRRSQADDEVRADAEDVAIAQDHETEIPDFAAEGSSSVSSVYDALRDDTAEAEVEAEAGASDLADPGGISDEHPVEGIPAAMTADVAVQPEQFEDLKTLSHEATARLAAEARSQTEALALADAAALSAELARVADIGAHQQRQIEAEMERLTAEAERLEVERLAAEEAVRVEAERVEAERLAAEEARLEAERLEAERLAAEAAAAEEARLEAERVEEARLEAERLAAEEAVRVEAERVEAERLAAEAAAAEEARLEAERLAVEEARLEAERLAAEVAAAEEARLEAERLEALSAAEEVERLAAAEADAEAARIAAEMAAALAEVERIAETDLVAHGDEPGTGERDDLVEAERLEAERLEAERLEEERAAERKAAEQARIDAELAEAARVEAERLAAEEARLAVERAAQAERDRFAAAEAAALAALAAAPSIAAERTAQRAAADAALAQARAAAKAAPARHDVRKERGSRTAAAEQPELFVAATSPAEPEIADAPSDEVSDVPVAAGTDPLEAGRDVGEPEPETEPEVAPIETAQSSPEEPGEGRADDAVAEVEAADELVEVSGLLEPEEDVQVDRDATEPLSADLADAAGSWADDVGVEVEEGLELDAMSELLELDDGSGEGLGVGEPLEDRALDMVADGPELEEVPESLALEEGLDADESMAEAVAEVDLSIEESAGNLVFDQGAEAPVDVDLNLEEAAGKTVFASGDEAPEVDDWAAYVEGYSAEGDEVREGDLATGGLLSRMFGRRRRKKALAAKRASDAPPQPLSEASQPEVVPIDDDDAEESATHEEMVGAEDEAAGVVQAIPLDGSSEAYQHIEAGAFDVGGSSGEDDEAGEKPDADSDTQPGFDDAPGTAEPSLFDDGADDDGAVAPAGAALVDEADSDLAEPNFEELLDAGLGDSDDGDLETWEWDDDVAIAARTVDVDDELAALDRDVAAELADEGRQTSGETGEEFEAAGEGEAAGAELSDEAATDEPDDASDEGESGDDEPDADASDDAWDNFTAESYVRASTAEHAGLAAAMERAATEETEQIAISASMPGVESGLVGLEDVVAASGEDVDEIVPRAKSDLPVRIATALLLIGAFFASLLWSPAIGLFVVAVVVIAAIEFFTVLTNTGHNPLTLFGLAGVVGAMLGTWAWGPVAIPATLAVTLSVSLVYYGIAVGRRDPLSNLALTAMGVGWIGGFGALVFEFINAEDYQWLMIALVLTVALSDVAQYFGGRNFGRRPLAPVVSPKKTVEGLVSGILVAVIFGAALSLTDSFTLQQGLITGGIVAVFAPIGDLAVSVVKRTLGIKDMGVVLPGHGGVLDRIDAMIFTVPALWIAWSWMGLLA